MRELLKDLATRAVACAGLTIMDSRESNAK